MSVRAVAPSTGAEVRRSARNGIIGLAGAAINGIAGFALTIVIVRSFGAAGSGALFTAIALVTIAGVVCCLGADTALVWALPRRTTGVDGDAGRLLLVALGPPVGLAVIVATIGVLVDERLAGMLLDDPSAGGGALIRLAVLAIPVIVAVTILLAATRGVRPVAAYVGIQSVFLPISRLVAVAVVALAGAGVVAGFGAWLLPAAVAVILAALWTAGPLGVSAGVPLRARNQDWRQLWRFALPRAASAAIDAGSMWIGVLLTAALAGQSEAGIFGAVGRYALAGLLIMHGLRVAVAPQLSRLLGEGQRAAAAEVYRQTSLWIVVLSWPAYLMLAVFSPAFLDVFGPEFRAGATALAILAIAMLVNVGVGLVQTLLLMSGNSRGHLFATATGLACNIAGCLALVPSHGALGAALAWSVGIVVENLIAAVLAQRALGEPLLRRDVVQAAAVVAGATGLTAALGVAALGRGPGGFAIALAALAVVSAASLANPRVRQAARDVPRLIRKTGQPREVRSESA